MHCISSAYWVKGIMPNLNFGLLTVKGGPSNTDKGKEKAWGFWEYTNLPNFVSC